MTARLIDGKAAAAALRDRLAEAVAALPLEARRPGLAVVLVGDDPASQVYVQSKGVATRKAGMISFEHRLPADIAQAELLALVARLNADPAVDGILVQMPLPAPLSSREVILAIDPVKDVDGLHPFNIGLLTMGEPGPVACTPKGCMKLIAGERASLAGLEAVVVGRSALVGKPLAQLLLAADCTVTTAHSRTPRPCRRLPPGRHPGGGGGSPGPGQGRLGEARRHRHRRGHQPDRQAGRRLAPGRRRRLRRGGRGAPARSRRCRAASGP